jgi:hypothetical protein
MSSSRKNLLKVPRVAIGILLSGLLLYSATLATRDCTVGVLVFDNCAWVWMREWLGLPASKLLRAMVLESIGLGIAIGLYLTIRYIFPFWKSKSATRDQTQTPISK